MDFCFIINFYFRTNPQGYDNLNANSAVYNDKNLGCKTNFYDQCDGDFYKSYYAYCCCNKLHFYKINIFKIKNHVSFKKNVLLQVFCKVCS